MRMSDFVVKESISADLAATTKEGVIREMVENLRQAGYFKGSDSEDVVKEILRRELLGSTGIGRGVAIPHTKHGSVDRLIGTVAVSRGGVPFESLDGEPVPVFALSARRRPAKRFGACWKTRSTEADQRELRSTFRGLTVLDTAMNGEP